MTGQKRGRMEQGTVPEGSFQIPGVYVPSFYRHEYNDDGTLAAIIPLDGAPKTFDKRVREDSRTVLFPHKMIMHLPRKSYAAGPILSLPGMYPWLLLVLPGRFSTKLCRARKCHRQAVETLGHSVANEITCFQLLPYKALSS